MITRVIRRARLEPARSGRATAPRVTAGGVCGAARQRLGLGLPGATGLPGRKNSPARSGESYGALYGSAMASSVDRPCEELVELGFEAIDEREVPVSSPEHREAGAVVGELGAYL